MHSALGTELGNRSFLASARTVWIVKRSLTVDWTAADCRGPARSFYNPLGCAAARAR